MPLRGRPWFFKKCYREVRQLTKHAYLAHRALELGFGSERTQGHILQASGAAQFFLERYPQHCDTIRDSEPTEPFVIQGEILDDWLAEFADKRGQHGRERFGYNWDSLRTYLTGKYGGSCTGGGGGDNEFEIVVRLMAEFL